MAWGCGAILHACQHALLQEGPRVLGSSGERALRQSSGPLRRVRVGSWGCWCFVACARMMTTSIIGV
jgi:hypothetical protein